MKLEVGKVYRAKPPRGAWRGLVEYGGGYLWVCEKTNRGSKPYTLKSVATGQTFKITVPEIWFEEAEDEAG